jgi:hypothetical protein
MARQINASKALTLKRNRRVMLLLALGAKCFFGIGAFSLPGTTPPRASKPQTPVTLASFKKICLPSLAVKSLKKLGSHLGLLSFPLSDWMP